MKKRIYEDNGVMLSKTSLKAGDTVELIYMGLLKNSGATHVKAHIGYNESWEDTETFDMEQKDGAFTVTLALKKPGILNCAFVDLLGNWDNNSGENYSFKVAKATAARKEAAVSKTAKPEKAASKPKVTGKTKTSEPKKAAKKSATTKPTSTKKTAKKTKNESAE